MRLLHRLLDWLVERGILPRGENQSDRDGGIH